MPPKTKQLLDQLQGRTGAGNMTEVIRKALNLLDFVSSEMGKGKELILRDPNAEGSEQRISLL